MLAGQFVASDHLSLTTPVAVSASSSYAQFFRYRTLAIQWIANELPNLCAVSSSINNTTKANNPTKNTAVL